MTYCADLLVKGGLPMLVDVQPNIALDNIVTFRGPSIWAVVRIGDGYAVRPCG